MGYIMVIKNLGKKPIHQLTSGWYKHADYQNEDVAFFKWFLLSG